MLIFFANLSVEKTMKSFLNDINSSPLAWQPEEAGDVDSDSTMSSSSFTYSGSSSDESMISGERHQHDEENNGEEFFFENMEDGMIQNVNEEHQEENNQGQENQADMIRLPNRARPQHEINEHALQYRVLDNLRSHPRSSEMLFRVALCEELPLVRADIDWNLVHHQLGAYPSIKVEDPDGDILLQSILRMDPPCHVIDKTLELYPKSCVNMDSFYVACQYASDEAAQMIMRRTMKAREREGIQWGMLAFLGDGEFG